METRGGGGGAQVSGGDESRDEGRDWSLGFPTVDHRVRGGPGRIFQGCNVSSAPALIHNGTKCCQASPFQENLPVSAGASPQMSREEQAAPPALPARWEDHFLGDTIIVPWGGRAGVMENIPSRTWRTYFPSLASSHERGCRMDCSFSPPPFSRLCLFCSF